MAASSDLVTVGFVQTIRGEDVDEDRCADLITYVSTMVREHTGSSWDADTVPMIVAVTVANIVGDALANTPADEVAVKAEQIGDYRVEYARGAVTNLSLDPYLSVLDKYRPTGYSISAGVPFDGVEDDTSI